MKSNIILPLEIVSKILLYIPTRYPFLDCIRGHERVDYSIITGEGPYGGMLSIRRLDEDGYSYDIVDCAATNRFNNFLNHNYTYLAPISPSNTISYGPF
tara:strand:+ start:9973 stop:10269 length:297 start_codon:yes stop_codon:yes gene_type:complete